MLPNSEVRNSFYFVVKSVNANSTAPSLEFGRASTTSQGTVRFLVDGNSAGRKSRRRTLIDKNGTPKRQKGQHVATIGQQGIVIFM
jgi:hypothetical protein